MKKIMLGAAAALMGLGLISSAQAAAGLSLPKQEWSFTGVFGSFDNAARQRGFQVFRESCSGCHSLDLMYFRNFADLGYSEDEIKALAAEYTVIDGPDDDGEMFERPGKPFDRFPAPFPNKKAAAAANGGAVPPDLSLMAKARIGGTNYLHALLTGYMDLPEDWKTNEGFQWLVAEVERFEEKDGEEVRVVEFEVSEGLNFNKYFPGHQIAMAPPLSEGLVEYEDGTEATVAQMAHDVSTFLMWTAEPKLEERKRMGIKVILFLLVFTGILYAVKRKIWADLH